MSLLIFIDDVTCDGNSKMNSEVYRNILSANIQRNASNPGCIQLGGTSSCSRTTTKHTANRAKLLSGKTGRKFPTDHVNHQTLSQRSPKILLYSQPQNKQLKEAVLYKSFAREEHQVSTL